MEKKSFQGTPMVLIVLGIVTVFGTLFMWIGGLNIMLSTVIKSQTRLVYDSDTWRQWKNIPIPVYMKVRFFNITNPHDFSKGAKPILQEVGPYVYRERLYKDDIMLDELSDTVKYRPYRDYFFEPDMSNGTEQDVITMINIPFVAAAKLAHRVTDVDYLLVTLDDMLTEKGEKLFRNETVHDILWGFSVQTYVDFLNNPAVQAMGDGVQLPSQVKDGKMGMLAGKNGSDEGWFEVVTGKYSSQDFGRIVKYNNKNTMTNWRGESCNTINGTDGIIFPPFMKYEPKKRLYVLVPDMCRSIPFEFTEMVEHDGIPGMRFRQPQWMYQAPKTNPNNWCFCPSKNFTDCEIDGLLNMELCMAGAPIYASQPHLLFVEDHVQEKVIGLNPNVEEHYGYMDLYPLLGLGLEARHRIQFNLQIQRWDVMPTFSSVPNMHLPLLWVEEGGTLTGINKVLVKALVLMLNSWAIGKYLMLFMGGVIFPAIAYYKILLKKRKDPSLIFRDLKLKRPSTSVSSVATATTTA